VDAKQRLQILIVCGLVGYLFWNFRDQPWTTMRAAGAGLMIPAFALWLTARIQLGKSFAIRAQAKKLVTHGLYARIRNPIYVFGTFLIAGIFLFLGRPMLLLLLIPVVVLQQVRIRKEERVLQAKFGDAYLEYKRQTWF